MCNLFGGNYCTWIIILLVLILLSQNGGLFGGCGTQQNDRNVGGCGCGCGM